MAIISVNATRADSARNVAAFCSDYKRGFVLGFSHQIFKKTGERLSFLTVPNITGRSR